MFIGFDFSFEVNILQILKAVTNETYTLHNGDTVDTDHNLLFADAFRSRQTFTDLYFVHIIVNVRKLV